MSFHESTLKRSFWRTAMDTLREIAFGFERLKFRFNRSAGLATSQIPDLIIPQDKIFSTLKDVLSHGYMTQMNAVSFLCVLSVKHKHSKTDPVKFFRNFIKLYNAQTVLEIAQIEKIGINSSDYSDLIAAYNSNLFVDTNRTPEEVTKQRIASAKIWAWSKDIESTTGITAKQIETLLESYQKPAKGDEGTSEANGKTSFSAFPKEEYFELLRPLRNRTFAGQPILSETQCGIILCMILHARETRRNGDSYITHPMAVANLVRLNAQSFLEVYTDRYGENGDKLVWMAMIAALLHDGGEKSYIDLYHDLEGLLPQPIIKAIQCLHKKDDEDYFSYLERCASDPLAAVVKLCDLCHNSLDNEKPSAKQEYIYPIAAQYIEYRLQNPDSQVTVAEFCTQQWICTEDQFTSILYYAGDGRKNPVEEARVKIGIINTAHTLRNVFTSKEQNPYAYPRREENPSLQL